jgi:3-deoxy-D-manno-octulosonic-acid transferase
MGGFWHGMAMRVYRAGIGLAAACGHAKARGWLAMRQGRLEALGDATSRLKPGQQWMWFHCASVGEYEQARPVMEAWRSLHPGDAFLLSFYSASGWDAFTRRQPEWWTAADHVTAMPLDVRASMRSLVQAAGGAERLRGLLFAKYDVWPTLVSFLTQARVPVGLFAGHVLPGRWPFRWGGGYQRQAWKAMRRVWVQTEASLITLSTYGVNAQVAGDPRFDRVLDAVAQHQPDQALQTWVNDRPCLVVGSAWQPEWDAAREAWQEGQCAIVAAHEWIAASIAAEASRWEAMGARSVVWSAHRSKDARAALPEGDVLIVDTMGELLDVYAVADVVVVGGGFGNGVHNTLEPAAHGKRILVGPEVERFAEVAALEATGALSVYHSHSAMREAIQTALQDVEATRRAGAKATEYAHQNAGAGMAIARGWTEAL